MIVKHDALAWVLRYPDDRTTIAVVWNSVVAAGVLKEGSSKTILWQSWGHPSQTAAHDAALQAVSMAEHKGAVLVVPPQMIAGLSAPERAALNPAINPGKRPALERLENDLLADAARSLI